MDLLFDLDGTLTDPYLGISRCIAYAFDRLDRPMPPHKDLRRYIGPPLRESFAGLLSTDDPSLVESALAFYRERFSKIGLYENDVYADIPEALAALRENGHTLYVATAKPEIFAKRIVDHFDLRRYFKKVYGCALDGTLGDKTSLIAHVLQREALASSSTTMIGDRKHDMIGAKANGVRGFGVLWGYGSKEELAAAGARVCVQTPRELNTALNDKEDLT